MSDVKEVENITVQSPPVFQVKSFVDASKLKIDLTFSGMDLSDAMMIQAGLFAYYGQCYSDAEHQTNVVKALIESTEAAVYKAVRDKAISNGEKPTEAQLSSTVAMHPRIIGLKKALNSAKREESTAKTALEAFRHKRDMLVQMGLISREEMKGEVAIRTKFVREEVAKSEKDYVLSRLREKQSDN